MSAVRTTRRHDFFNSTSETPTEQSSGTYLAQRVPASSYLGNLKKSQEEKPETPVSSLSGVKNEIGYANLINQIHTRAIKRGFVFNIMLTGRTCLGKSSFINSLLMADFYNADLQTAAMRFKNGKNLQAVEAHTVKINENKVNLKLTILDTPGFGEKIDNSECFDPLVEEIESRYQQFLQQELKIHRSTRTNGSSEFSAIHLDNDPRVHACLYFLPPTTIGLSAFDLEAMQRLHKRVNLIPIIAKADSLTPEECKTLKKIVLKQLSEHRISFFRFDATPDAQKVDAELNKYRSRYPFAVVSSNTMVSKPDGSKVRGRQYPWGVVETDSMEHNDFVALKMLLVNCHLHDLIDKTHFGHYATYRQEQLSTINKKSAVADADATDQSDATLDNIDSSGPLYQLEIERRERQLQLQRLESEMDAVFETKVRDRAMKFQEREQEFEKQSVKLQEKLDEEMHLLEQEERQFQLERAEWESANRETLT
ncbi:hypothetical protein Ciccas_002521, partial [Cichlidogyrus casuarinus]